MNLAQQQDLMIRFARCRYVDGGASYEECDCTGAVRLILQDYGGGIELPGDITEWKKCFEIIPWPTDDLRDMDVLLAQYANSIGLIDHMAVHVGNGYMVHIHKRGGGMMCERVNKYRSKILQVARYRK